MQVNNVNFVACKVLTSLLMRIMAIDEIPWQLLVY